ncbi:hypothetical protein [Bacteriovorax sp. Seq25_V]|uniref:hypothetical protein n=1 Tax=Bacteriovorax sp. Seq25_V TaxID=1201288 RepID=UPI00038A2D15|nr:hypothetical protein [Bacteriovorax sp. Seq25_V]EQC47563.1 hypothetical protein M900_0873 [Bacteriovorax sp. Seq25_V]
MHIKGDYRKNGTYVQPHIRSKPNSTKSNDYGPANSAGSLYSGGYTSPYLRDSDNDGISTQYENEGISDDYDSS